MNRRSLIWQQLEKDLDLYKFYLELILKAAVFVFGITGALVSYFLTHKGKPLMVYSLLLPIVMNFGFFLLCILGIPLAETMRMEHSRICKEAEITLPYELGPLPGMLRIFSAIYGLTTGGLIGLFILSLVKIPGP